MNDQVITLDKNDDLSKLHSKIEWSDGRRVIVIVPRGSKALTAEHEFKLLRRWADQADVQVALISTAYGVNELAQSAGLVVFSSAARAAKAEWRWQRGPGETALRRATPLDESAAPPLTPLLDRLGLAGWKLLLTVAMFGLAAVLLVAFASLLIPSATVTLQPASILISDTSEIILDPTVTTIDQINAIVPALNDRVAISGTVTVNTTKTATAPADRATGSVTFTNFQGTEATIPLGTIVATTSGVTERYSTTITATLPAGFNGRVTVPVRALKPGPEGNVRPLQVNFIEGQLSAVARVVNLSAIGGGTIKDVKIVSLDDRTTARERLNAELKQRALGALQAASDENGYIVPASVQVIVLGETFDQLVDDPSDTLSLKIDAVASGIKVDYNDLETFAQRRLVIKLPSGYEMLPGTLRVEADPNARAEANSVILKLRSALLATPQIDTGKVLDGLDDAPLSKAIEQISARVKLAKPPQIKISPSWWTRLPFFRFRTTLLIQPAK